MRPPPKAAAASHLRVASDEPLEPLFLEKLERVLFEREHDLGPAAERLIRVLGHRKGRVGSRLPHPLRKQKGHDAGPRVGRNRRARKGRYGEARSGRGRARGPGGRGSAQGRGKGGGMCVGRASAKNRRGNERTGRAELEGDAWGAWPGSAGCRLASWRVAQTDAAASWRAARRLAAPACRRRLTLSGRQRCRPPGRPSRSRRRTDR